MQRTAQQWRKLLYFSGLMVSAFMVAAYFVHSFAVAIAVVTVIGFFNMLFMTLVNSTIQLDTNDHYRGRVMSFYTLAFAGTTLIGNLFAGSIIEKFGPSVVFLMCGGIAGLLIILILIWMANGKRKKEKRKNFKSE